MNRESIKSPWRYNEHTDTIYDGLDNLIADLREDNPLIGRLIAAAPELLDLAEMVADEYPDAADWKDAKPALQRLARIALSLIEGE